MNSATLVCWTCKKKQPITFEGDISLALDLVNLVNGFGWVGVLDLNRKRALVFCSEECKQSAKKKDGTYRRYPRKLKEVHA